jgi:sugar phosphate isomerase/epimerase
MITLLNLVLQYFETSNKEAVDLCAPYIFHCHYKDWVLKKEGETYTKKTCLMGEGSIPWREVFAELQKQGYSAYLSDEYEKYWYPNILPEAETGMKKNREYVRKLLGK